MGRKLDVQEVLSALNRVSGVRGSMFVTRDGMVVVSDVDANIDSDRIAAMAATLAARTNDCLQRTDRGSLVQAMLDATAGKVFMSEAEKGILVLIADSDVNVGLVRLEMRSAVERLKL